VVSLAVLKGKSLAYAAIHEYKDKGLRANQQKIGDACPVAVYFDLEHKYLSSIARRRPISGNVYVGYKALEV